MVNIGDKVRYYVNSKQYVIATVVEKTESGAWVEFSNGQQKHMDNIELDHCKEPN